MKKIIYTAILGPYDDLKEPTIITPGWDYVCYTDQDLVSNTWIIHKIPMLPVGPARTARYLKLVFQNYAFNHQYSMWIDASFTINCDLNEWWDKHFVAPFTCISHPIRNCVYAEARVCIKNKRGNDVEIAKQAKKYAQEQMPPNNGLISSGILMRENTNQVRDFCLDWYIETSQQSTRDQLSYAYVAWKRGSSHHNIVWDYRKGQEFIFLTHIHRRK